MVKQISLTQLRRGQSGVVVEITGGRGVVQRLLAMGVRPGKRISKISDMFMRGPVTVRIGGIDIALGFGTANKIIVEVQVE